MARHRQPRALAQTIKPATVALSLLAIAIILGLRRWRQKWPGLLIAVAVTAALTFLLHLDVATVGSRFGELPRTLPSPTLPAFDLAKMLAHGHQVEQALRGMLVPPVAGVDDRAGDGRGQTGSRPGH